MDIKKIGEIKAELELLGAAVTRENETQFQAFIENYKVDDRGGVQKIVATAEKRLEKYYVEVERTESIQKYEKEYEAFAYICGIDEVGRGPLAGPVYAAAVILPPFNAVAAMDRASIRHTPANCPSPGLEPSRLGKFRVV